MDENQMRKILLLLLVFLIIFLTISVFLPPIHAQVTFEQLTTNPYIDGTPSWSPDGTKITYCAFYGGWYRHIWVMNSDGSGKTQLTFGNVVDSNPVFSPDGTKIAFQRWGLRGDYYDIMIMDADGSNIQRITFGGLPGMVEGTYDGVQWSQDGSTFLFGYREGGTGQYAPWWICTIKTDGSNPQILERGFTPKYCYGYSKIIFTHTIDPYFGDMRIAIMNNNGTGLEHLTAGPSDWVPDMSPVSNKIAFSRGMGTVRDLYLMDSDGSNEVSLISDGKVNYQPNWSPSGEYIVYTSGIPENYDIWRVKVDVEPPIITIDTPVNYGLYPADSEEALSFYASDNMDLDPDVTAVIVDFEGNEISVSSGDDLPSVCGLYTLSVTATDDAGNSASKSVIFIVYDPSVGFATGGGWIIPEPEEGNCKANFCFVVKYNKESKTPGGNLEFQYNFRNINLKSIEIYWLVISNNKAMFQGTATINGQGLYTFRVQATDGDLTGDQPDNFKIKIWEGTDTEADPIHNYYDDLAGGNIKIHKK